jgi:DNA mismatch repair protein MutS
MAGKSTYLRQAALIIIMAHLGSFVPAQEAKIGIVDRVFSRIGASDRIVKGESTFLVEMIETSRILHYATERSFIIMDEIGRGTSTYDGLSIAWAVLEYLLDSKPVGAKVLFATHYHEITALNDRRGIINCNVKVKEWNNSVIFLRKIEPGSASKSYGIEVARMAGIPDWVIERAKSILGTLEMKYGGHIPLVIGEEESTPQQDGQREMDEGGSESTHGDDVQLGLFPSPYEILIKELKRIDIDRITPLEALSILEKLKKSI